MSYGRVDHGVKENIVVDGGSNTDVVLSNLDSGVEYEATIRGFSEDGTDRRVSTPVESVNWTTGELFTNFPICQNATYIHTYMHSYIRTHTKHT